MGLSAVWLVFCEGLIGKLSFCSGLERLSESLSMGDKVTENAIIKEGSGWAEAWIWSFTPPYLSFPLSLNSGHNSMVLGN